MDHIIKDFWPQISFVAFTLFGFGKVWQLFNIMCRTLKEHSDELRNIRREQSLFCNHAECEKYRDSCAVRNDKRFDEIKTMLQAMDNKRENGRDDFQSVLSEISRRLGKLEGQLEAAK
jgi:hypothetical protein